MQNFEAKDRDLNNFTIGLLHTHSPNYDLVVICSLKFTKVEEIPWKEEKGK